MTEHQLEEAASETRDRCCVSCRTCPSATRPTPASRPHPVLGREKKQNAIVRARFQVLIDGLREFSNDNQAPRCSASMPFRQQPPRIDHLTALDPYRTAIGAIVLHGVRLSTGPLPA